MGLTGGNNKDDEKCDKENELELFEEQLRDYENRLKEKGEKVELEESPQTSHWINEYEETTGRLDDLSHLKMSTQTEDEDVIAESDDIPVHPRPAPIESIPIPEEVRAQMSSSEDLSTIGKRTHKGGRKGKKMRKSDPPDPGGVMYTPFPKLSQMKKELNYTDEMSEEGEEIAMFPPGYYKVLKKLNIREGASLETKKLGIVRVNTIIFINEMIKINVGVDVDGKPKTSIIRGHIDEPLSGWISLVSADGQKSVTLVNETSVDKSLQKKKVLPQVQESLVKIQKNSELLSIDEEKDALKREMEKLSFRMKELEEKKEREHEFELNRYPFSEGQRVLWLDETDVEEKWIPARILRILSKDLFDIAIEGESTRIETMQEVDNIRVDDSFTHVQEKRRYKYDGIKLMNDIDKKHNYFENDEMRKEIQKRFLKDSGLDLSSARMVSTIAGGFDISTMEYAMFEFPTDVSVDPATRTLYVVDAAAHKIKKVTPDGDVQPFAGGRGPGFRDGIGSRAKFFHPVGCHFDRLRRRLIVTDFFNMCVRMIDPITANVTTIAGVNGTYGFRDGKSSQALFCQPYGVTADLIGNIYVSDHGNHFIRKISQNGIVDTVRGVDPVKIELSRREGVMLGDIDFPERINYKHYFAMVKNPTGIAVDDDGTIYVASRRVDNAIFKITKNFEVHCIAGDAMFRQHGWVDGFGTNARFNEPYGLRYFAHPPKAGWGEGWKKGPGGARLLVSDTYNSKIRAIDVRNGEVRSVAGIGGKVNALIDGLAMAPKDKEEEVNIDPFGQKTRISFFFFPRGVDMDLDGNIFVADTLNHAIRRVHHFKPITLPPLYHAALYLNLFKLLRISTKELLDIDPTVLELLVVLYPPVKRVCGETTVIEDGIIPFLQHPPIIKWEVPALHDCVIVMMDIDHPRPFTDDFGTYMPDQSGNKGPYLHWLVTKCVHSSSSGTEIAPYEDPGSVPRRQGRHRILFLLFKTTRARKIQYFGGYDPRAPNETRENFNIVRFASSNGLVLASFNYYVYVYPPKETYKKASRDSKIGFTPRKELRTMDTAKDDVDLT